MNSLKSNWIYALMLSSFAFSAYTEPEDYNPHLARLSGGISPKVARPSAVRMDPVQLMYKGTLYLEYEAKVNQSISVYTPVFFSDRSMTGFPNALFWKTSVGFGLGAKFHFLNQNDEGLSLYIAPEAIMMVAYGFPVTDAKPVYRNHPVYKMYEDFKDDLRNAGPFWIPITSIWLGTQYVDKDSGFTMDAGIAARIYNMMIAEPEVKLTLGYAF